jgi:hypothetical protein
LTTTKTDDQRQLDRKILDDYERRVRRIESERAVLLREQQ